MVESQQHTIGILRECKNKWERRCSLTPREVKILVEQGVRVLVQPSTTRCYSEDDFEQAGAIIQEDMTECQVIFGVKEVPMENLLPNKTYFFFSHTIKAQPYNMPLLDKLFEKKIRMVDFECIRDVPPAGQQPQRLVAFGRYAGIAGAFDFIRGVGEYLLERKYQTPFVFLGSSYMYEDYEAMCDALKRVAKNIHNSGLPKKLSPIVFGVTGTGRCAQGSLEVLEQLPHVKVPPSELRAYLADTSKHSNKQIVISQFTSQDVSVPTDGQPFDKARYYKNPENFRGVFHEFLDCVSFLVNDIYWETKYPRLVTKEQYKASVESGKNRMWGVCDISADECGSIEFTSRFTSIEHPFILYNPISMDFKENISDMQENDMLFHSVDHLPAEMPREASNHFGSKLLPFVLPVCKSDINKDWADQQADLPGEIYNAVITAGGKLTPEYSFIANLREANEKLERMSDRDSQGMQGFTLKLTGHLFDTKVFNTAIDCCEEQGIIFRVVNWEIGCDSKSTTEVTLQGISANEQALDAAEKVIIATCEKSEVTWERVQGPNYDQKIVTQMVNHK